MYLQLNPLVHELEILNIFFKMYYEFIPLMMTSNDMHAYNSHPIYGKLGTRGYMGVLLHFNASYLIHEELHII